MPDDVAALLDCALVAELTVLDERGQPRSYPLIPLWDGEHILMTSSILFSRKLERIKRNPKVSVSLSDPVACPVNPFLRATIQGLAKVIDEDIHSGWERLLPLWTAKEPGIIKIMKLRFALPLFWERAVIEITPVRVFRWDDGDTAGHPDVFEFHAVAA